MADTFRNDFPLLAENSNIIYLDSAATTQKARSVISAMLSYNSAHNANVHRGLYSLSLQATKAFESVRGRVATFIGAHESSEIIFTKGATESLNLLAHSLASVVDDSKREIVISEMEHHANIVPWQQLEKWGFTLKVIPVDSENRIDYTQAADLITSKTALVSIVHISNVTGVKNDVQKLCSLAHGVGALFCLDAAQSIAHIPVDVSTIDCDFCVFSAHKMYGPMGVGVLYGKKTLLTKLEPYQTGGDMIESVSFTKETTFASVPMKFEAGTPNVEGVIGLGAALDYISKIGFAVICEKDAALLSYAKNELEKLGCHVYPSDASILSFTVPNIHPHDLASLLDDVNVCIRAGHHCAMPLMEKLGVSGTARISFGIYTTIEDIDACIAGLQKAMAIFNGGTKSE